MSLLRNQPFVVFFVASTFLLEISQLFSPPPLFFFFTVMQTHVNNSAFLAVKEISCGLFLAARLASCHVYQALV